MPVSDKSDPVPMRKWRDDQMRLRAPAYKDLHRADKSVKLTNMGKE